MGKISFLQMTAICKGKGDKVDMSQWIDAIVTDAGNGLTVKEVFCFSIKYDNYEFPFPDEVIPEARLANFFIRAPEEIIDNELCISQLDYGICSHLATRLNPFKLSFRVSYSSLSWEPDSKLTELFIET